MGPLDAEAPVDDVCGLWSRGADGVRERATLRAGRRQLRPAGRDRCEERNRPLGAEAGLAGTRLCDGRERRRLHGDRRRRCVRLLDERREAAVARPDARGRERVPGDRRRPPRRRRRHPGIRRAPRGRRLRTAEDDVSKAAVALAFCLAALVAGCGGGHASRPWASANGSVESQRAVTATELDARTIPKLKVRWRFRLHANVTDFGAITSNPIIEGNRVYLQDSTSSVYALDARSGALVWKHSLDDPNDGPNGLSISGSRIYGATDTTAFALDAATGRPLWSRRLAGQFEQFVAIAPIVDRGRVYVSTQGFPPGGRGVLYALSAATGRIVWRFQTIKERWAHPESSGGGGSWYAVSIDEQGNVYAGIANPGTWGGSSASPNGGSFPGPALYTDSLVVLAGATGKLLWYDQVTQHDVRDYDFQVSPILASV